MIAVYVGVGVALFLILAVIVSYNRFVNQRNLILNAWSNIDTELKRRYDLIPNLVRTVQTYAEHERATLAAVTEARARAAGSNGTPAQQAADEAPLVGALRQLLAVAEGYPELQASENFLALQRELAHTEDRIQAARRFYNANVADHNRRVQAVPSNLIAWIFDFGEAEYFTVDRAVGGDVDRPPAASFPP